VIANNLANLNTVGFKGQSPVFQDLFYQQLGTSGNGNAIQVGVGVSTAGNTSDLTQGSIESTGVPTDVAIQGDGYFILNQDGETLYTRAGDFTVGSDGQLLTQGGAAVQGYQAVDGVIQPNATLGSLAISAGLTNPPKATTQVQLALNLNAEAGLQTNSASQQTGTGIPAGTVLATGSQLTFTDGTNSFTYTTAAGDTLASVAAAINANSHYTATLSGNNLVINATDGNAVAFSSNTLTDAATSKLAETFSPSGTNAAAGTFSTSIVVNDALGATHVLTYNFTKTAANTWNYQISVPASDLGSGGNPIISTGTLTFDGSGKLVSPSTNVTGLTISNLADGASPLSFSWNLYNGNGGSVVTQVAGSSATSSTSQDGYSSGSLLSYTIGSDGIIQGIFSNGQTSAVGQIALASFSNEQGLIRNGSNNFLSSLASGSASIGDPGTGGRGTLSGGSVEQSNVDIATQFAQLILAERDYQANAKVVTTFDEVTQTTISLIS
jgi:flagellar hook protein FlgE